MSADLDSFAGDLMRLVRDEAIRECDRLASGQVKGPDGERWNKILADEPLMAAVHEVIPDIVDQTLFELLKRIDDGSIALSLASSDGSHMSLEDLGRGEMAGSLMGSPGWRHRHSVERFSDPFAGLELELPSEHAG